MSKPIRGEFVSGNYFQTFGITAFTGRTIVPPDDQTSAAPVAMLSYRTWQQQYGADPRVMSSTFILDSHPVVTVVITRPGFFGETLRSDPPQLVAAIGKTAIPRPEFSAA